MDQRHVGRAAWMIIHTAAVKLDLDKDRVSACVKINNLMKCMAEVFPCGMCRDHMKVSWTMPSQGCKSVFLHTFKFHNLVTQRIHALKGTKPPQFDQGSCRSKYEYLLDSGAWKVYMMSFLYSVVSNCTKMCDTLEKKFLKRNVAFENYVSRIERFTRTLHTIFAEVRPFTGTRDQNTKPCNKIMCDLFHWEETMFDKHLFGDYNTTRERHLCSRVRSDHYEFFRPPAQFCNKPGCMGCCSVCDKNAAKLLKNK